MFNNLRGQLHDYQQSIFSPKVFAKQNLIDLNMSLLKQKREASFFNRIFSRAIRKKKGKTLSQFMIKEKQYQQDHIQLKQMELIDDPIYTCLLKKKKEPLLKRIADFTNFFKVFQPQATWLIFWNLSIALIIIYYFFEIGLVIFLGQPVWISQLQSPITYTLNVLFIIALFCDAFIQLNTGYYNQGILIMSKLKIVTHYFKLYFLIDFISILVVTTCFFSGNKDFNYAKILFFLKITVLNRIDVLYQKMLIFYIKWNMVYLILRQIIIVVLTTHYLGVIFFAVDNYVYTTNYYGPNTPLLSWIYNASAYSQLIWEPWYMWFIYSFYFALGTMTTIAYGDITPLNPIDTVYTIFVLVVCCIQFSYTLYNILQIFFMGKAAESQKDEENLHLNKYMKTHKISHLLQVKVRAFIQQTWNAEMYRNRETQQKMLNKLPKELKIELLSEVYEKFVIQLLGFKYPKQFLNGLVGAITQYRSSPQQHIIKRNQPIEAMYYVINGLVSLYLTPKLHLKQCNQIAVGVLQYYTHSEPQFSVVTVLDSNIYKIQCQQFGRLIRKDEMNLEIFQNISDQSRQETRKCELFNIQCLVCEDSTHTTQKCPNSHYIIDPYATNSFYIEFKQLRQKFKRINQKRRLKKYANRREQRKASDPQIGLKHTITLHQISEMELCGGDLDLNDIDQFVNETLQMLQDVQKGLMIDQERQQRQNQVMQQMKQYEVYMRSGNIRNVLKKINKKK